MQLCVASFSFIMENDRNPLSEISTNLPNSRGAQILSRSKRRQEEAAKHEQCRRFVNSIPRPSSSSATGSGSVSAPGPGTSSSPPKKSRRAEIEQSRAENNEADKRSQSSVSVTTNVTINNTPGGNNNQQSFQTRLLGPRCARSDVCCESLSGNHGFARRTQLLTLRTSTKH